MLLWTFMYKYLCERACMLSLFSCVQLFAILWTAAHQAPLSVEFSWQEHWSGLPCLPPGDLPNPGIKPMSLTSPVLAGGLFTTSDTSVQFSSVQSLSRVRLFATPRIAARQASLSITNCWSSPKVTPRKPQCVSICFQFS